MKSILSKIFIISFFLIIGCTNQSNIPSKINNSVKTFYDGYLANDSNMIKSVLETDYQSVGYPTKENIRDVKSEINFINNINNVHTDLSIENNSISTYALKNGYKVYVTGIEKFKHNETGNSIDLRFADIWTLNKSGKIKSRERFQDVMDYWSDINYGITKKIEVTFLVDMSNTKVEKGLAKEPSVYVVSGSSTGPSGIKMTKEANGIWSGKVMMPPGKQEFKFRNGLHKGWNTAGWADGETLKKENKKFNKISIFMNVFDCHVNRTPCAGLVEEILYKPGKFLNASLDKASEDNERNYYKIKDKHGNDIVVVQIAGLVARRIVCETNKNQEVNQGDRIGMIRYSSRADVNYQNYEPLVKVGQTAISGETLLAKN